MREAITGIRAMADTMNNIITTIQHTKKKEKEQKEAVSNNHSWFPKLWAVRLLKCGVSTFSNATSGRDVTITHGGDGYKSEIQGIQKILGFVGWFGGWGGWMTRRPREKDRNHTIDLSIIVKLIVFAHKYKSSGTKQKRCHSKEDGCVVVCERSKTQLIDNTHTTHTPHTHTHQSLWVSSAEF